MTRQKKHINNFRSSEKQLHVDKIFEYLSKKDIYQCLIMMWSYIQLVYVIHH